MANILMRPLNVIGVAGQKQSGKDSLSDYLAPRLFYPGEDVDGKMTNRPWGRGSFAAEVKRIFCETFMFDPLLIDEWKVKDDPPPGFDASIRKALTMIGDGFRTIMGDIWIKRAFIDDSSNHKVYSDIRYLNEAGKIRKVGGPNILLCRPDRINYDVSRSESELRSYALWCLETGREGRIDSWPEFQALAQQDGQDAVLQFPFHDWEDYMRSRSAPFVGERQTSITIPVREFIQNISQFDLFIRNDGTLEHLHSKVDSIVIPFLKTDFGYKV